MNKRINRNEKKKLYVNGVCVRTWSYYCHHHRQLIHKDFSIMQMEY